MKRILSLALLFAIIAGIMPNIAMAKTITDGGSTWVTIDKGSNRINPLGTHSGANLGGNAWTYTTNDGIQGGAFCVNWGLANPPNGKVLNLTGKYTANPKLIGAAMAGYPQRPLEDFIAIHQSQYPDLAGLTLDEYAYASQVAIWATLGQVAVDGTGFRDGRTTVYWTDDPEISKAYHALVVILLEAETWTKPLDTGLTVRLSDTNPNTILDIQHEEGLMGVVRDNDYEIKLETKGSTEYYTRTFTTASMTSTYKHDYNIEIWLENAPAGTIITDLNGNLLAEVDFEGKHLWKVPTVIRDTDMNTNGFEYYGNFKVWLPRLATPATSEMLIHATSTVNQYNVFFANNEDSSQQSYIICDPLYTPIDAVGIFKWSTQVSLYGQLNVQKIDENGKPLAGAIFKLEGSDGSHYEGTTNSNGLISWDMLNPDITYTLTETQAPTGFLLDTTPYNVGLVAGQVVTFTAKNVSKSNVLIKKIDKQNGYPLQGGVFEIEQIDGSFKTTKTTKGDGYITFETNELPFGSYVVTEKTAPTGYELDITPQTFEWDGKSDIELIFSDVRKPTIQVIKIDKNTHESLSGAVFDVYRNGQKITSITTDDAGYATVPDVKEGYYQFVETSAPSGYTLDRTTHEIYVNPYDPATSADPVLIIENAMKPSLKIIKVDKMTNARMANITFEVYRDTTLIGEYITDKNGEINLHDLQEGTYLVKEIATDNNHVINSTPQQIEIKSGQTEIPTLIFFNQLKPGIHLVKIDSETFEPLVNAKFKVKQVGGTFEKEYTTDQNGEIDLTNLEPSAYQVTEILAPNGYLIDDSVRTIQINADENALFVFTNTKKPSIEIVKFDPLRGIYLGGATFRIAKIEDGTNYLDRVTDENGRIVIDNLETGVYSVQEIDPPTNYVLNSTEYKVELFAGKRSQLIANNELKPSLKIVKTDAITGEPVAGVVFNIKKVEGETITNATTDQNGEILLEYMDCGIYDVWEKSVPDRYLISDEHQQITLTPNKTATLNFQNYKKPNVTIKKIDSITKDPIKGVWFTVIYASNNTFNGEINDLGRFQTDENGEIYLENKQDGWYRITEVEPADGYQLKEPIVQEVFVKSGEDKTVIFKNTPLSALIIKKVDGTNGKVLQGARFRVDYLSGTSGSGGTTIAEVETSAQGTAVLTRLKAGTYVITETKEPEGYIIDTAPKTVYISGTEQSVITVEFENQPNSGLIIKKLDKDTQKPLGGAKFKVTTDTGAVVGNANGEYITDESGFIHIPSLDTDTYIVTEIEAPQGYQLDTTPQTIKLKHGETHTLTFYDVKIGGVQIIKLDEETRQPIEGVEFEVSKMNGEKIGNFKTDKSGIIYLGELDDGWYVVVETKAAKGYQLNAEPHNIEVKNGKTTTIEITNRKGSSVLLHKIDSVTKNGIYGVQFLISDELNNPIMTVTSDQNGYVFIDKTLKDGKYLIREIQQANGYILDTTVKTFYLEYGATSEITWENTPILGQIQIIKKSKDDNPTNGIEAGTLLEGAVFEIRDKVNNVVDTIKSDRAGLAISKPLPLGRYFVKEIEAPPYYKISDEILDIELEHEGQIVKREFYNESVYTNVSIEKWGYGEVMPNQEMMWAFDKIRNNSTVALDSFYWRDTLPVDAVRLTQIVTGTYNQKLSYKIVYKTNLRDWATLADNLDTGKNYVLDASHGTLDLANNECVTEIMFVFGRVKSGFSNVEMPKIYAVTLGWLTNGYQFTNNCDVGGLNGSQWIMSNSRWITSVYALPIITKLPRTGY